MRGQYEAMLEIVVEPFAEERIRMLEKYAGAVERMKEAFDEKGDSVNAAAALAEMELARGEARAGAADFPGIAALRTKLSQEVARIEAAKVAKQGEIRDQYVVRLQKLRASLQTAGDLAGVAAVTEEARRLVAEAKGPVPQEMVETPLPPARGMGDWPTERDPAFVMGWRRGMGETLRTSLRARARTRLLARDEAAIDEAGRLQLASGSFYVRGASRMLFYAAQESHEITLEVLIETADLDQDGPARILTFSQDGNLRNFTLGQSGAALVLRLRTPETGENGSSPETRLCAIQADVPLHVIVTYRPGELVAYLNGEEVQRTDQVQGDFSNWDAEQELVIGDEFSNGRDWRGWMDQFVILNRFVEPKEALVRHRMVMGN